MLSGVAQSAYKMCGDVRLLANLKEVEEPFAKTQVCHLICSLHRVFNSSSMFRKIHVFDFVFSVVCVSFGMLGGARLFGLVCMLQCDLIISWKGWLLTCWN